jgi:hypothetical protein
MILQAGCETDVDTVDLPEFQQKLVITSFISPSDTVSIIKVRSNLKLFGELNSEKPLGLLTGYISDGTEEVALDTSGNGLILDHKKMQIKYGTTYKIKISSESGLSAEASCTTPGKKDFGITVDTFSVSKTIAVEGAPGPVYYRSIDFRITIKDPPEEENFYRFAVSTIGYFTNQGTQNHYVTEGTPTLDKEFITDKWMNGERIINTTIGNSAYYFTPRCDSAIIKIYLYNTEKSYYLYHKSLNDYNDSENPFAEATPVYSNITEGLGIFTSYTVDSLIVRFK